MSGGLPHPPDNSKLSSYFARADHQAVRERFAFYRMLVGRGTNFSRQIHTICISYFLIGRVTNPPEKYSPLLSFCRAGDEPRPTKAHYIHYLVITRSVHQLGGNLLVRLEASLSSLPFTLNSFRAGEEPRLAIPNHFRSFHFSRTGHQAAGERFFGTVNTCRAGEKPLLKSNNNYRSFTLRRCFDK